MSVFAIRHGETEWSLNGRHTSSTDLPLTERGRDQSVLLKPVLAGQSFERVLVSPRRRALETCELAGLGARAVVDPDLAEWDYGEYEGLTLSQIQQRAPGWNLFRDGCPGGESPGQVVARADRVIVRARAVAGAVAIFSHGHLLRSLAARWLALPIVEAEHFILGTGTVSVLDEYHEVPALSLWNAPAVRPG